jgi:hypothetical protein
MGKGDAHIRFAARFGKTADHAGLIRKHLNQADFCYHLALTWSSKKGHFPKVLFSKASFFHILSGQDSRDKNDAPYCYRAFFIWCGHSFYPLLRVFGNRAIIGRTKKGMQAIKVRTGRMV